jgi:hypothetical protein
VSDELPRSQGLDHDACFVVIARAERLRPARVLRLRAKGRLMSRLGDWARACLGLGFIIVFPACSIEPNMPPTATVTPIQTTSRPAKDPNCYMPIIYVEPTVDYQKVAIVDAWASLKYSEDQVLAEIKRKACETGADAVLYLSGSQQATRRLLYTGAPNAARGASGSEVEGDYINDRDNQPAIGTVGHRGTYVDAVAIVYTNQSASQAAAH